MRSALCRALTDLHGMGIWQRAQVGAGDDLCNEACGREEFRRGSGFEAESVADNAVDGGEGAAAAEHGFSEAAALLEVVGQIGIDDGGEIAVEDREVDLIVEGERTVIEVGGADDAPKVVDGHQLGVDHGGHVVVDFGAGADEVKGGAAAELVDEGAVDARAGGEDLHLYAAMEGFDEGAA